MTVSIDHLKNIEKLSSLVKKRNNLLIESIPPQFLKNKKKDTGDETDSETEDDTKKNIDSENPPVEKVDGKVRVNDADGKPEGENPDSMPPDENNTGGMQAEPTSED
jgi:hypothetical protein